ncbi:MAG: hypothetical protein UX13_C0035G0007 [Candidatus Woesebacteria bacterium GW2011_GWB1_45_5]|uniref:Uncharacterized protein n=1 Tax=Candidatus Woesebacteria bacterium GW2011_GWB1_45_5 TaxID=1618581 RepID=A0A0G1QLX1_9BACT|nr:MAG: hypothetical protein UX13_C0035G0007 [Candidatus Woesebacteria bacterium GW2011_GWB1_45_5]
MAKRPKGQIPYESEHPERPWMPDIPGHQQKRGITVTGKEKERLKRQIRELSREIVELKPEPGRLK